MRLVVLAAHFMAAGRALSTAREWFSSRLGAPKYMCAPMVDQSHLAFRTLVQRYGCDLCYAPMILNKEKTIGALLRLGAAPGRAGVSYLRDNVQTKAGERVVVQLAGSDPEAAARTAAGVLDRFGELGNPEGVVAFDLNLGCPQGIARKGMYGAFLLERDLDAAVRVVDRLSRDFDSDLIRTTCKVRLLSLQDEDGLTRTAVGRLVDAGASLVTVHSRTRLQNKQLCGGADWSAVARLNVPPGTPLVSNGGIATLEDVQACLAITGADAVMSSEALLANPALFVRNADPRTGAYVTQRALAREYVHIAREEPTHLGDARAHVFKMLHGALDALPEAALRVRLLHARDLDEVEAVVDAVEAADPDQLLEPRDHSPDFKPEYSWYYRYRAEAPGLAEKRQLNAEDRLERKLRRSERKALAAQAKEKRKAINAKLHSHSESS